MSGYRTGQLCLNGHWITESIETSPELMSKACEKCGAATITQCQNCGASIHGDFHMERICVIRTRDLPVPDYCHECGKPYPWTEARLNAAKELILEDEQTTESEQNKLIEVLPDMIIDTPRTQLAESRLKRFLTKAGVTIGEGLKDIIVDIASETIKKSMGLNK